ncbi:hypothetical protein [Azospirillum sp. B510]|uniref:hypothetical protein n=1 Tax=Azospirillum sp. (strain B510) TaxID=137722 RepID=UPI0005A8A4F2|nr:hypothetical protein [Azospirillum sp. B510]
MTVVIIVGDRSAVLGMISPAGMLIAIRGDIVCLDKTPEVGIRLEKLVQAERLERLGPGLYRLLLRQAPRLTFDRAWSNPGAAHAPDHLIALTLARPTFRDVVRLCRAYGVPRVRRVLFELAENNDVPPWLAADWNRRLDNIGRGFRRAVLRMILSKEI